MKCAFHPEVDAVGVCSNCGRAVCEECKTAIGGKIYCPNCAERRSGLLTAGGILSIIGGAFTVLAGLSLAALIPGIAGFASDTMAGVAFPIGFPIGIGTWLIAFGGVAIAGGTYALKRKMWGLSLAGAICAFLSPVFSILGLLAIIFISVRRGEFASIQGGGEK